MGVVNMRLAGVGLAVLVGIASAAPAFDLGSISKDFSSLHGSGVETTILKASSLRAKHVMDCSKPETFFEKTDFQGSDLVKGGFTVASSSECCMKCSEYPMCEYWSYGNSGSKKGKCWVKKNSATEGKEPQDNRDSGYYDPCQDDANVEKQIDYQ